jgi:hypothetical protein
VAGEEQRAEGVERSRTLTGLQALVALAWGTAKEDVRKNSANGRFADVAQTATTISATDRDHFLAVANTADTLKADALYAEAAKVTVAGGRAPVPTISELQPIAAARNSFAELALQSTSAEARGQLGYYAIYAWFNARARFAELQSALQELKSTSLEERRLLIAEALDLASHRVDAWITALIERRRRSLRQATPVGITVGAYGWVENIVPNGQRLGSNLLVKDQRQNAILEIGVFQQRFANGQCLMGERHGKLLVAQVIRRGHLELLIGTAR